MPITGVPSPQPGDDCCEPAGTGPLIGDDGVVVGSTPGGCADTFRLTPSLQQYDGTVLLSRVRTLSLTSRREATVSWTFSTPDGRAIDLTDCLCEAESSLSDSSSIPETCGYVMKARLREQLGEADPCAPSVSEIPVTVVDAATGSLTLDFNRKVTDRVGIYFVEIALVGTGPKDPDDPDSPVIEYVRYSNLLQVAISEGLWSSSLQGPPSLAEIRLWLRDTSPQESRLLGGVMFSDDEIMAALVRVVTEWNETPPYVGQFSTVNFPYRHLWLTGAVAYLYRIAAESYRKNRLPYAAAGVTIDDQAKAPEYEQAAALRMDEYRLMIRHRKSALNLSQGFGGLSSPYSW